MNIFVCTTCSDAEAVSVYPGVNGAETEAQAVDLLIKLHVQFLVVPTLTYNHELRLVWAF